MTRRISKPRRERVRLWSEAYKAEHARPGTARKAQRMAYLKAIRWLQVQATKAQEREEPQP